MFPGLKIIWETEFVNLAFLSCQKRLSSLKSEKNPRPSLIVLRNRQSNCSSAILSIKEGVSKKKH